MTAPASMQLTFCAHTDIGKVRKGNEDNFLALDLKREKSWMGNETQAIAPTTIQAAATITVFAVSDGMGGALAGEVASRMAVENVSELLLQLQTQPIYQTLALSEQLRVAIERTNTDIHNESVMNPDCYGMGATFTAVAIADGHAYFAQVGDSRAHLIRSDKITRITKDQSVVQQLIDMGEITEVEAETHPRRNYILQALGAARDVEVVINTVPLCADDILLLCSDGLSGKVAAAEMMEMVRDATDLQVACEQLIALANERGGEDNITVLLIKITGENLAGANDDPVKPAMIARGTDTPAEALLDEVGLSPPIADEDPNVSPSPNPAITPEHNQSIANNEPNNHEIVRQNIADNRSFSGKKLMFIFFALIILMSASVIYLNKSLVPERAALQQKLQTEQRTTITNLRTRIEALRQRAATAPEITPQLDVLSKRLDEAGALDATQYQQVGQACSEVENAIILLERNP